MRTLLSFVLASLGAITAAHAQTVPPQVDQAAQLGAAIAPGAKRHTGAGDVYFATDKGEWFPTLQKGQCYWFVAAATGSKGLYLYLTDPGNKNVATNESRQPRSVVGFCAHAGGNYHLEAKAKGSSFVILTFSRPGKFGELNEDGTPNSGPLPSPDPPPPCVDNGEQGGNASLVVGCECGAMEVYLDGQLHNFQSGSGRLDGQNSGCHNLKVVAWTSPFSRKNWYEGQVKLAANNESRVHINKNGLKLVGNTPLAPPPPPVDTNALVDAQNIVNEAIERGREEGNPCGARFDQKMVELSQLIATVTAGPSADGVDHALRKAQHLIEASDEDCNKRVGRLMEKKLRRVVERLTAVRQAM